MHLQEIMQFVYKSMCADMCGSNGEFGTGLLITRLLFKNVYFFIIFII